MLKVFCHHGCSVWIKYYSVYHLNRRSIGHGIVGMGSGIADFSRYCCISCGNVCRLSHCWRGLLLVSHALTKKYAPIASWITGWLTLVGNWTITCSINFSGGQLILSAITLWREDFMPNQYRTIVMFWAIMVVCTLFNIFGAKYLDLINKICIYWTSASVMLSWLRS